MKPLQVATLATAGLFTTTDNVEAQSFNFSPSYGYRAPGAFGGAGNFRTQSMIPIYNNEIRNPGGSYDRGFFGYNPYTPNYNNFQRPNNNGRTQVQNLSQPQPGYSSSTRINTPGFQGNFQYSQNSQQQSQAQIIAQRPDPTIEIRKNQIREFGKLSSDGSFIYVNNIIMKAKDGSLYYSPDWHLIIPKTNNFQLPEMADMRRIKDENGGYIYLVSNEGVENAYKKEVEASSTKTPTQRTNLLRQHCCCCCQ
jgi:hypothetical protein